MSIQLIHKSKRTTVVLGNYRVITPQSELFVYGVYYNLLIHVIPSSFIVDYNTMALCNDIEYRQENCFKAFADSKEFNLRLKEILRIPLARLIEPNDIPDNGDNVVFDLRFGIIDIVKKKIGLLNKGKRKLYYFK